MVPMMSLLYTVFPSFTHRVLSAVPTAVCLQLWWNVCGLKEQWCRGGNHAKDNKEEAHHRASCEQLSFHSRSVYFYWFYSRILPISTKPRQS